MISQESRHTTEVQWAEKFVFSGQWKFFLMQTPTSQCLTQAMPAGPETELKK